MNYISPPSGWLWRSAHWSTEDLSNDTVPVGAAGRRSIARDQPRSGACAA
ncbi:hypothetical protein C4K16_0691 [Pseudomonas chlororaphis subsp. aurantiaca]|nr:hypothetical protein C4K16_0691 [Pseudomonas chlororaphis subsp. aurantiaca]